MEQILSNTELYRDKIFTINCSEVDFGNKKIGKFERVISSSNTGTGVLIVAIDKENNIFLIEQFQITTGKRLLVLPRGGIENGVSIETKVNDELQEEIGYKANKITKLTEIETFPGWHKAKMFVYLAEELEVSKQDGDEIEDIQVHKIPFQTCIEKIMTGEISDARTIAGLFFAKEYFKL